MIRRYGGCIVMATGMLVCIHSVDSRSQAATNQIASPTHRQIRVIRPEVDGKQLTLKTLTTDPSGQLLVALGGQSMQYEMVDGAVSYKSVKEPGYILKLDSNGEELARWSCEMTPSAIAVAPDGTIFVGGSGKLIKLLPDGKTSEAIDSPHVGDRKTFAKRTIRAQQRLMQSFLSEESLQPIKDMIKSLEEKPEDERSQIENAQLQALQTQLKQMEPLVQDSTEAEDDDAEDEDEEFQIDPMMEMQVEQAMSVTSMAASPTHVFVCATDPSNGGYSVWAIDHDLDPDSAKVIVQNLRGCCGQMDIQCCGEELVVSENTSFQVGFYDAEGNRVRGFGSMDRSSQNGFGSCCNPMNSLPLADGTILTAESSIGHIKHFDADGNLLGYVGKANIGGGCKHCAMGYDEENDLYYMMYQDKNAICVLGEASKFPPTPAELAVAQQQEDFLAEHAGTWTKEGTTVQSGGFLGSLFGGASTSSADAMIPVTSWTISKDGSVSVNAGQYASFMTEATFELLPSEPDDAEDLYRAAIAEQQVRMIEMTMKIEGDQMHLDFGHSMKVTLLKQGNASQQVTGDPLDELMPLTAEQPPVTRPTAVASEAMAVQLCDPNCDGANCGNPSCSDKTGSVANSDDELNTLFDELFGDATDSNASPVTREVVREETYAQPMVRVVPAKPVQRVARSATPARSASRTLPSTSPDPIRPIAMPQINYVPTYEYKLVSADDLGKKREKALNEMGADGWDFCGKLGKKLMFKRTSGFRQSRTKQ